MPRTSYLPRGVTPSYRELSHAFWYELAPEERVAAMRRGELTLAQLAEWSRQARHEVPLLNGEFEWIAVRSADVADQLERTHTSS